jgi:hypothetical protein
MELTMFADVAVGGGGLVSQLLVILFVALAVLLIWAVGRWVGGKLKAPEIVLTGWDILFVLIGLVLAVNFLMTLAGHGFIHLF